VRRLTFGLISRKKADEEKGPLPASPSLGGKDLAQPLLSREEGSGRGDEASLKGYCKNFSYEEGERGKGTLNSEDPI